MRRPRVHIIDGSGYIFRAYYAIRSLSTAKGEPTNAVYGFTTMIEKALRDERPEYIAIAFDAPKPTFRSAIYPEYKAHRGPPPDDLIPQFPRIHEIVDAFCLPRFREDGFEADDIIATLTKKSLARDYDVHIITGDKDLMQLVSDRVTLYDPMKDKRFGPADVIERFGVPPHLVIDVLALAGDASDNIPGVRGIGEKTAAKLIQTYGDLESTLAAASGGKVKGKQGETLAASAAAARLSKQLVRLDADMSMKIEIEDLKYRGPDKERLRALFVELEFRKLVTNLDDAATTSPATAVIGEKDGAGAEVRGDAALLESRWISRAEDLRELAAELAAEKSLSVFVETSTTRLADAKVIGIAIAWGQKRAAYVPIGHDPGMDQANDPVNDQYLAPGEPKQLALPAVLEVLRPIFESREIKKVSSDSKSAFELLARHGVRLEGIDFDTTIGDFLLEPDDESASAHSPEQVARRFLGQEALRKEDVLGKGRARIGSAGLAMEPATRFFCERASIAFAASVPIKKALEEAHLYHVFKDVELPLVPVLARMELCGIKIDLEQLGEMGERFATELVRLEQSCYEAAGKEFNIGSPKQLQKILFEELELRIVRRTKTGPSTDAQVLEALADSHALPQAILDYRQVQKLKSTYVDALPKMVCSATGRVHTVYSQSVAATGRLSSTDPNLQNIPIRSDLGKQLRKVFIAEPGNVLISVDYSQVELRVLAHLSGDAILADAFRREEDVHTRTAAVLFDIDPSLVTREQRTQAKAVNFGVLYGMGPVRLSRDLKIPRRTASQFIEDYFVKQAGVKKYVDDTLVYAREHGFVKTMLGRRRFLRNINGKNRGERAAAERVAINTPIQGSAADLIKLAMVRVDARLREEFPKANLLLQVHDELLVEAPEAIAPQVFALVRHEMERVYPMSVPLNAEGKWGASWDLAH